MRFFFDFYYFLVEPDEFLVFLWELEVLMLLE